jgi:hypothetical protein
MKFRILILTIAALAIAGAVPNTAAAADEKMVLRIFDVSGLTSRLQHAPLEPFGASPSSGIFGFPNQEEYKQGMQGPEQPISIDELVELIRTYVRTETWDEDGVSLACYGSHIYVSQTPAILDRVAAFLDWADENLRRRIELGVHWLVFGPESVERLRKAGTLKALERGTLDDEEVGALLAESARPGNEHESGSASSILGQRVAIRRSNLVTYLKDYDVEIAQAAQIGDPICGVGREGLEVYVRARPLSSGSSVDLQVLGRAGRFQRPFPVVHLEAEELGTLQLPAFETFTTNTGSIVESGRTSATGIWSPMGEDDPRLCVLLVRPSLRAAKLKSPETNVAYLDCGFLASPRDEYAIGMLRGEEDWYRPHWNRMRLHLMEESRPLMEQDAIVDALRFFVDPASWETSLASLLPIPSGGLFVGNTPEFIEQTRAIVGAAERAMVRGLRTDIRLFTVPLKATLAAGGRVRRGTWADRSVLDTLGRMEGAREIRRVALNTVTNRWASCQAGIEYSYVAEYDVEVAQEARISDPIVGQIFSGLTVNVLPTLSPSGKEVTLRLGLRISTVDPLSVKAPVRTDSAMNGILHQPEERTVRYNGSVTFPRSGCRVIDAGAGKDGEGRRLIVVISAN